MKRAYPKLGTLEDIKEECEFSAYCIFQLDKIFRLLDCGATSDEITSMLYTEFVRRTARDKTGIKRLNLLMSKIVKKLIRRVRNETR